MERPAKLWSKMDDLRGTRPANVTRHAPALNGYRWPSSSEPLTKPYTRSWRGLSSAASYASVGVSSSTATRCSRPWRHGRDSGSRNYGSVFGVVSWAFCQEAHDEEEQEDLPLWMRPGGRANLQTGTRREAEESRQEGRSLHCRAARVAGQLHILRHTFCSHLAMKGAPAKAIQELAGHANLSTTLRYMHLSPSARDGAIALLNRRGEDGEKAAVAER